MTTAGRFSGRAPIAKATAAAKTAVNSAPRARFNTIDTTSATPAIHRICRVSLASCLVSGDLSSSCAAAAGDLADLGTHADRGDDELPRTAGHIGVHVDHVGPVAQRRVRIRHRVDALGDGQALPGERGLGDLQRGRPHQPAVGRNEVAGLDRHHIAGHELLGGDLRHRRPAAPWP